MKHLKKQETEVWVRGSENFERKTLPVETLFDREHGMARLYQHWTEAIRHNQMVPRIADISPLHIYEAGMLDYTHLVRVSNDDPQGYQISHTGAAINVRHFHVGMHLADSPCKTWADNAMADFNTVKNIGIPLYQLVNARIMNQMRQYTRVILPIGKTGRKVDHVLIGVHPISPMQLRVVLRDVNVDDPANDHIWGD